MNAPHLVAKPVQKRTSGRVKMRRAGRSLRERLERALGVWSLDGPVVDLDGIVVDIDKDEVMADLTYGRD